MLCCPVYGVVDCPGQLDESFVVHVGASTSLVMDPADERRAEVLREHQQWLDDMARRAEEKQVRPHRCNPFAEDLAHGLFTTPREVMGPLSKLFACLTSKAGSEPPRHVFRDGSSPEPRDSGLASYNELRNRPNADGTLSTSSSPLDAASEGANTPRQ